MGCLGFIMSESDAILKKGTKIKIFGCPFTILEDVKLDTTQEFLDKVLSDQEDYYNGINTTSKGTN